MKPTRGGIEEHTKTEAERVRERAGLTRQQLAKKARISEAYLRQIENHGRANYALAERLAILCRCPIITYL